jgi:hypothetical protein
MDKNFDGLIDYYEFAECIGKNTNSKAIQDIGHITSSKDLEEN